MLINKSSSPIAKAVKVDTTNFDNNLSATDNTVQKALDTIDDLVLDVTNYVNSGFSDSYQGNYLDGGAADTIFEHLNQINGG